MLYNVVTSDNVHDEPPPPLMITIGRFPGSSWGGGQHFSSQKSDAHSGYAGTTRGAGQRNQN